VRSAWFYRIAMDQCDNEEVISNSELDTGSEQGSVNSPVYRLYDDLMLLLDWDDTLFPTTMITKVVRSRSANESVIIRNDQIAALHKLGNTTLVLLAELVTKYGANNIYIVTNRKQGWIRKSLYYAACISKIYKQIDTFLVENEISMVSAQSMYAKNAAQSPRDAIIWKQLCFDGILKSNKMKGTSCSHIVSISDDWIDHHAVKKSIESLATYSPTHHIIKLKSKPTVHDMANELVYVQTSFYQIFDIYCSQKPSYFIDSQKTPYFANPLSVRPVIIDYHREEMNHLKHLQNKKNCPCKHCQNNRNLKQKFKTKMIKRIVAATAANKGLIARQ